MGKVLTTGQIISTKKASIRKLNNLLEGYINSTDTDIQKKAYLISSWIQQFVSYVSFEEKFDPTKNISYKRGNIIKANLGFNIGCELGGPHYAIVLDKNNKHSSDTLTIIPLISAKEGKPVYERDIFLGNELYNTLNSRYNTLAAECLVQFEELEKVNTMAKNLLQTIKTLPDSPELSHKIDEIEKMQSNFSKRHQALLKDLQYYDSLKKEISIMKEGSIARIEQITSISKMRIWIPKSTTDALYNISYSENTMRRINEKVKELFVFDE